MVRFFLFALLVAAQAEAGAWPRDQGAWFASSAVRLGWPKGDWPPKDITQYYTLYLEYGATDSLTLGLDIGRSVSGEGKTVFFARHPLRDRDNGAKLAMELGLGKINGQPVVRPGLSVGYGYAARRGSGWISLDTVAEISTMTFETDVKADITFGRSMPNNSKWILQLQTGKPHDEGGFARLAPSYVIGLGKRRMAEIGLTWGLQNDGEIGLKIGMWHQF